MLMCMLDSENYTDPVIEFCETREEGFQMFKDWVIPYNDPPKFEVDGNRCDATWWKPGEETYDDFAVCEVFDLNEKPYILIWWHAYDGVDFDVKQFSSFEEANAVMRSEADDIDTFGVDNEPTFPEDWGTVIDNGYEWNCWKIIKKGEGCLKSENS